MANTNKPLYSLALPDKCCTAETGCFFDGSLRNVVSEPIYVQKVYDAALFNLQGLTTVTGQPFTPVLGAGARILRILDVRCRKFFNPANINDPRNLVATPTTTVAGAEFVQDGCGRPVTVIGPDGTASENLLFVDTEECDELGKGTPIFGTQSIEITGNVIVEIDAVIADHKKCEKTVTLSANVPIAKEGAPLVLTNFFELCIPSVFDTAFLPRFTEFCNISCESRLATNSIMRDIMIDPNTGAVRVNLIIALCVTCEKKIVVPVQLCVLSTGFPVLQADVSPICTTFPQLFPDQIDKKRPCPPRKWSEEGLEASAEGTVEEASLE
ncbi:hypothetical protein SAMN02745975_01414 [Geosporobacter subterraneus DSM 17957]|uniref:Uncharacterized protein n=1 Tax=Geosporobacter subterraneus DSM 17957 TaxID=1121919 RepID=A0A1M6GZD5_9FIRM|nr:hypothetical protein [Geosporobacter subterraneus]SHJ15302.1 hypothetical protein SAMN02745975_01414 [Geosporobacter subterraneus DSM 17957]